MNLPAHEFSEGAVDHLMTGDATATLKSRRNDSRLKMGLVVGADPDFGVGEPRADEFGYFFRVHGAV